MVPGTKRLPDQCVKTAVYVNIMIQHIKRPAGGPDTGSGSAACFKPTLHSGKAAPR